MYSDRTHSKRRFAVTASIVTLSSLLVSLVSPAFAQSGAGRLSSNPHDLRDAFAANKANIVTPQAFGDFVAQNAALSQRYARHFGVPQDRLVSFFRTSLVSYTLPNSQTMTTFGVTTDGTIYPVKTTLPQGTRVWATREGVPVLKWNCSNPLTTVLPGSTLNTPLEYAVAPSLDTPEGGPVLDVPEALFATNSPSLPVDNSSSFAIVPPLPAADFAFGVPAVDTVASAALPGIGDIIDAGGSSITDLWPALLVPVVLAVAQGGNNGEVVTGESEPLLPGGTGATVVPETNTSVLLLAGLPILVLAFGLARRRKLA